MYDEKRKIIEDTIKSIEKERQKIDLIIDQVNNSKKTLFETVQEEYCKRDIYKTDMLLNKIKKNVKNILIAEAKKGKKQVILKEELFKNNENVSIVILKDKIVKWLQNEQFYTKNNGSYILIKGWE